MRFAEPTATWIAEQAARGGWFTARAQWIGALYAPGSESEFANSPWRREKGGLWDVGPHALSVLLPVLGDVTELTAARGPADATHLILRHASGASSTVTLALDAPLGAAGTEVEFRGESGSPRSLAGVTRSVRSVRRWMRCWKRCVPGCRTPATCGSGCG